MAIKDIVAAVAPPPRPIFPGTMDLWETVQTRLGVRLPVALREFANNYGSGRFDGGTRLQIYNPCDPAYEAVVRSDSECYIGLREESPDFYPYKFYPEPGGLFPVAYGDGGGIEFFLLMEHGDPKRHSIVYDDRCTGLVEYREEIFDFFYEFLCNNVSPYFQKRVTFVPEEHVAPML